MRKATAIILILLTFCGSYVYSQLLTPYDSITPPPGFADTIIGPQQACEGEPSLYTTDIPIGCSAEWYLDGVLQISGSDSLEILWTLGGNYILSRELNCDTSNLSTSYLEVEVTSLPEAPSSISGAEDICIQSTGFYSTQVSSGEGCQWMVDGIVQPSDSAQLSYYWESPGWHTLEVRAVNDCGLSPGTPLQILVNEWPEVDLGNDTTLLEGQSLTLDAGNPECSYLWSTGETTQTIVVTTSGWYEVTVSNTCGNVLDGIRVEVIVGTTEEKSDQKIIAWTCDNKLFVQNNNSKIERIQVFDLQGNLYIDSTEKPFYLLPGKGLFLVNLILSNQQIIRIKVLNL